MLLLIDWERMGLPFRLALALAGPRTFAAKKRPVVTPSPSALNSIGKPG